MRITGGINRGRHLICPEGNATRPTSDRARAALFNVLNHAHFAPSLEGARVLDLFAGTGALGLEALSWGAEFAVFIEKSSLAMDCLEKNIKNHGQEPKTNQIKKDALLWLMNNQEQGFDFIFLDPPYHQGLGEAALCQLLKSQCVHNETVVIYERGVGEGYFDTSQWQICNEKTYGPAQIYFLKPLMP